MGGTGADETARNAAAANTAALTAHAANDGAHHVKTPAYVLPAAAPNVRGGVQAITNAVIDADTSTGIFGWGLSHVKRVINALVPQWARTGTGTTLPASVIGDDTLIARMFGAESVDNNALAPNAVRRHHVDNDVIGPDELDNAILARIPPALAVATRGYALRQAADGETWELVPAAGGGAGHWYEMAQLLTNSLAADTAADMTLRTDGMTRFADAAAVRAAIANDTISMLVLQRSDSDAQVLGAVAPNFIGSQTANYAIQFRFPNGDVATVRFTATAITVTPGFAITSTLRFDLGVFA